uniref:Uncharacterized protein n=1 Tax=Plectus sambesii TaxID=2011161 RepID=A0A914VKV7_9BILA
MSRQSAVGNGRPKHGGDGGTKGARAAVALTSAGPQFKSSGAQKEGGKGG